MFDGYKLNCYRSRSLCSYLGRFWSPYRAPRNVSRGCGFRASVGANQIFRTQCRDFGNIRFEIR